MGHRGDPRGAGRALWSAVGPRGGVPSRGVCPPRGCSTALALGLVLAPVLLGGGVANPRALSRCFPARCQATVINFEDAAFTLEDAAKLAEVLNRPSCRVSDVNMVTITGDDDARLAAVAAVISSGAPVRKLKWVYSTHGVVTVGGGESWLRGRCCCLRPVFVGALSCNGLSSARPAPRLCWR